MGLELTFVNGGSATVRLTVRSAVGYAGGVQTFEVRAGATVKHVLDLRGSRNWYDFTVVSDVDATFLRRFAGHVETGVAGTSDPGLVTG